MLKIKQKSKAIEINFLDIHKKKKKKGEKRKKGKDREILHDNESKANK